MSEQCLELMIYQTKAGMIDRFLDAHLQWAQALKKQSGFICIDTKATADSSGHYNDLIYWKNLEAAQQANAAPPPIHRFAPLADCIEQIIYHQLFVNPLA